MRLSRLDVASKRTMTSDEQRISSAKSGDCYTIDPQILGTTLVFDHWHAFLDGKLHRASLAEWIDPSKIALSDFLQRAVAANIKRLSGSCKNLLKHVDALWKFVDHEGVDPTNNHAERELRPIVLWRKSSFGSKSESGDRFVERVMSVVQTARKLGRSARDYILDAIRAQLNSEQAPLLLA